jgi:hypothetical protein
MTYVDYLKSKKHFLLVWFLIHGFALFVNIFGIEGNFKSESIEKESSTFKRTYKNEIHLFTTKETESQSSFWPFVSYSNSKSYNQYAQEQPIPPNYGNSAIIELKDTTDKKADDWRPSREQVEADYYKERQASMQQNYNINIPIYRNPIGTIEYSYFYGIFYQYDFSEFLAYSFLIFLFLYLIYNFKKPKTI